jgi:serine/threonine protein kinase
MHARRIGHRDLKLENILIVDPLPDAGLIGDKLHIKLADFGLAKRLAPKAVPVAANSAPELRTVSLSGHMPSAAATAEEEDAIVVALMRRLGAPAPREQCARTHEAALVDACRGVTRFQTTVGACACILAAPAAPLSLMRMPSLSRPQAPCSTWRLRWHPSAPR